MPITVQGLLQGTYQALPVSFDRTKVGQMTLANLNIVNFEGTKLKQFNAFITSSTGAGVYSTRLWFTRMPTPVSGNLPDLSQTTVLARCACQAYYFYFVYANAKIGGQISGNRFKPYVRKTPPPPAGYPYKNPGDIPGVCKHIIFLINTLKARQLVT